MYNFRYEKHPIIKKKVNKTIECYNYKVECQTVQELLDIKDNAEAIHFESLIIRFVLFIVNNKVFIIRIQFFFIFITDLKKNN